MGNYNLYRCTIIIEVDGEKKALQLDKLLDEFFNIIFYEVKPVRVKRRWGW